MGSFNMEENPFKRSSRQTGWTLIKKLVLAEDLEDDSFEFKLLILKQLNFNYWNGLIDSLTASLTDVLPIIWKRTLDNYRDLWL